MSKINHIAIIMDGNGRWAESRCRPRIWGHVRGAAQISDVVEAADHFGIKALTLFAFSTENWCRPKEEVSSLFTLLRKYIERERQKIIRNKIRFRVIGDIFGLPEKTRDLILDLEEKTRLSTGLKLNFAFDYGGRSEIINSVNKFIHQSPGQLISESDLYENLYLVDSGDVDLLIRTGGDCRISNFLLWQMAYAELYFTKTKWPEFSTEEFRKIYYEVSLRQRRFGGIDTPLDLVSNLVEAKAHKASMQHKVE
jgi:undecaprenyl diphosphate synthase